MAVEETESSAAQRRGRAAGRRAKQQESKENEEVKSLETGKKESSKVDAAKPEPVEPTLAYDMAVETESPSRGRRQTPRKGGKGPAKGSEEVKSIETGKEESSTVDAAKPEPVEPTLAYDMAVETESPSRGRRQTTRKGGKGPAKGSEEVKVEATLAYDMDVEETPSSKTRGRGAKGKTAAKLKANEAAKDKPPVEENLCDTEEMVADSVANNVVKQKPPLVPIPSRSPLKSALAGKKRSPSPTPKHVAFTEPEPEERPSRSTSRAATRGALTRAATGEGSVLGSTSASSRGKKSGKGKEDKDFEARDEGQAAEAGVDSRSGRQRRGVRIAEPEVVAKGKTGKGAVKTGVDTQCEDSETEQMEPDAPEVKPEVVEQIGDAEAKSGPSGSKGSGPGEVGKTAEHDPPTASSHRGKGRKSTTRMSNAPDSTSQIQDKKPGRQDFKTETGDANESDETASIASSVDSKDAEGANEVKVEQGRGRRVTKSTLKQLESQAETAKASQPRTSSRGRKISVSPYLKDFDTGTRTNRKRGSLTGASASEETVAESEPKTKTSSKPGGSESIKSEAACDSADVDMTVVGDVAASSDVLVVPGKRGRARKNEANAKDANKRTNVETSGISPSGAVAEELAGKSPPAKGKKRSRRGEDTTEETGAEERVKEKQEEETNMRKKRKGLEKKEESDTKAVVENSVEEEKEKEATTKRKRVQEEKEKGEETVSKRRKRGQKEEGVESNTNEQVEASARGQGAKRGRRSKENRQGEQSEETGSEDKKKEAQGKETKQKKKGRNVASVSAENLSVSDVEQKSVEPEVVADVSHTQAESQSERSDVSSQVRQGRGKRGKAATDSQVSQAQEADTQLLSMAVRSKGRKKKEVEVMTSSADLVSTEVSSEVVDTPPTPARGGNRKSGGDTQEQKTPQASGSRAKRKGAQPEESLSQELSTPKSRRTAVAEESSQKSSQARLGRKAGENSQAQGTPAKQSRLSNPSTPTQETNTSQADDSMHSPLLRKSTTDHKPKVMFTGVIDEQGEKIIHDLGGELAAQINDCTHLVTDKIRRTVKLLGGLAKGALVVSPQWLISCKQARTFLDGHKFLVKDPAMEKQYKFSLATSLAKAAHCSVLEGYRVHVSSSVRPEPAQMQSILECAGAQYLKSMPNKMMDKTVVISSPQDEKLCQPAIKAGIPVVGAEFILTGVLRQEVDIEQYKLFASSSEIESQGSSRSKSKRK